MYDKQVVRRRRAVLIVLVVLSIVLLTGYFGEGNGGFFHGIQNGAQVVLSPIETGASKAFTPVRNFVNWAGNVFSASSQNKKLKKELRATEALLAEAQTASHDNGQLRGLLGLSRTAGYPGGVHPIAAQVIFKSPSPWYSTIAVDRGSSDGVKLDQPVVAPGGLAGKISQVSPTTAVVTLITDASSAVSAEVEPDGAAGVVRPAVGNPNDMQLQFVQKGGSIHPNDTVITSGFSSGALQSLYPRGIPIGRVTRVSPDELQIYQRVHIEPFVDFRRLDYVQILTGSAQGTQAASTTAPAGG